MKAILHQSTVLLLNRNWQAIHVKTQAEAFCMMAAESAKGLDVRGDGSVVPVCWEDWLKLPVRDGDRAVHSPRGAVRAPTVIVASNYNKVPLCRPSFGARGIWLRDGGICQYTGRKLAPHEGNIDHVVPLSRGGASSWENCVLSHRDVNARKGARMPDEAGLRLLRPPAVPRAVPATANIENRHDIADWRMFLA